jgi:GR25 family glycosyltransferase involved in LPS biosynthesis
LANIDLSHLRVLKEGVTSGADWVLIIEDDAQFADPVRTAGALGTVFEFLGHPARSIFVNLSESIDTVELRVEGIVSAGNPVLALSNGSELLEISPAVSNTVCANVYSLDFARDFASAIEVQGILPSVPIDWRLNQLIMEDRVTPVECYWVKPGLFLQGSMHKDSVQSNSG